MNVNRASASAALLAGLVLVCAAERAAPGAEEAPMPARTAPRPPVTWDTAALAKPPQVHPAPGFASEGVRALFYEGLPWKGKPTRVFAWYGAPKTEAGQKVPAMVLIHGGGGTAFPEWVRLWNARGYAAISMDTCGCTWGGEHAKRPRHDFGGPPGWGGFDQLDQAVEDQWMYHAVADSLLATSLVASFPEVDAERIGLTGISWGGIVACIAAGVDARLKCVAPVYGCGFLDEIPGWIQGHGAKGDAKRRWADLWDPSRYLPRARMPMLWVSGTNDFAFPLPVLQKSYRAAGGPRALAIRVAMAHGQEQGAAPEEIAAFADHLLEGRPAPARITGQGMRGTTAWATFQADAGAAPVVQAELNFTADTGPWEKRPWQRVAANLDAAGGQVSAAVPDGATVWYLNLIDQRGRVVSTEHTERP